MDNNCDIDANIDTESHIKRDLYSHPNADTKPIPDCDKHDVTNPDAQRHARLYSYYTYPNMIT